MSLKAHLYSSIPAALLLAGVTGLPGTARAADIDMKFMEVTNLTLSTAVVSWVTDQKTTDNWVEVSSTDTVMTFNDSYLSLSVVHYVELVDLKPNTDYKFRFSSGGVVWDNGGQMYSFKTLQTSNYALPASVRQLVVDENSNVLGRVLVRIRVARQGDEPSLARTLLTISNIADGPGYWITNYTDFLARDGSLYYPSSGDKFYIDYIANYWTAVSDSSFVVPGSGGSALQPKVIDVFDPTGVIKGDIDGNGAINIFDLLNQLKILGGSQVPADDREFGAADVDSNGKINIFDLLELLKLLKQTA